MKKNHIASTRFMVAVLIILLLLGAMPFPAFASNEGNQELGMEPPIEIISNITVIAVPSHGGSVSGSGVYKAYDSCTMTAVPNDGWKFDGWFKHGEYLDSNPNRLISVPDWLGDVTYEAHFSQISTPVPTPAPTPTPTPPPAQEFYKISTSVSPGNGGSVSGGGQYQKGQTATLYANTASGFAFYGWYINGSFVSDKTSYSFTVTSNITVEAIFNQVQIDTYKISTVASPNNGGSVSGGGEYAKGKTATVYASAADGYTFGGWYESGALVSTQATLSFTVTAKMTLEARFTPLKQDEVFYRISATVTPNGGGVVTGTGDYVKGKTVELSAAEVSGHTFIGWYENGNLLGSHQSLTITVMSNRTLEARFSRDSTPTPKPTGTTARPTASASSEPEQITITATAGPGGGVEGGGQYSPGDNIELKATADDGYMIDGWYEDGSKLDGSDGSPIVDIIVMEDRTLEVLFIPSTDVLITAQVSPDEGGSVIGGGTFQIGDGVELEAVAGSGYKFEAWYENGNMLANSQGKPKMSFTAEKDREVEARFAPTGDAESSRRGGRRRARFNKNNLKLEAGTYFRASDYLEIKDADTNATLEGAAATWTVSGNTSDQTTINPNSGLLMIAADEGATELVITATPVQDTLADSGALIYAGLSPNIAGLGNAALMASLPGGTVVTSGSMTIYIKDQEITITPNDFFLHERGDQVQFSASSDAVFIRENYRWSVSNHTSQDTRIDEQTGLLTIGANEESAILTVTARGSAIFNLVRYYGAVNVRVSQWERTDSIYLYGHTSVIRGDSFFYGAYIMDPSGNWGPASGEVRFSVTGNLHDGTRMTGINNDQLYVDRDEESAWLQVTATRPGQPGRPQLSETMNVHVEQPDTGLFISPLNPTVSAGDRQTFTVTGQDGRPPSSVRWTVDSNLSTIDEASGTLIIGPNETAEMLLVTVTTWPDMDWSGHAVVSVRHPNRTVTLNVAASPSNGGSAYAIGGPSFLPGDICVLRAEPAAGWRFAGWQINGMPTVLAQNTSFMISDLQAGMTYAYTARFVPIAGSLQIITHSLPEGRIGRPYFYQMCLSESVPAVWILSPSDLPPGLLFDVSTGILYGIPTMSGTFTLNFRISADNAHNRAPLTLRLTMRPTRRGENGPLVPVVRRQIQHALRDVDWNKIDSIKVNKTSLAAKPYFEDTELYSPELLDLDDAFMDTLAYGTNTLGITFKDGSTLEDSFDLVTTDLFSGGAPADYIDREVFVDPDSSQPGFPWAIAGVAAAVLAVAAIAIIVVKKRSKT